MRATTIAVASVAVQLHRALRRGRDRYDAQAHARDSRQASCVRAKMMRGPQGVFKPLAGAVKATTGARSLSVFPVEVRDGEIWLAS